MASFSTMYNYIDKYIQKNASAEIKENYHKTIRAFLYMSISNKKDADKGLYEHGEECFNDKENEEFKNLVIGCLANMKRVYGDQLDNKCDFDEVYRQLTKDKSANLDEAYRNISKNYVSKKDFGFSMNM